ncbi:CoA transferase [Pseudonocardia sp. NPDC049154]|uniref:CoA transferase n=1 Tax=Pseudonocardia sp. NPDC049154 TaxID=3155501 RepID=UPI0033D87078
MLTGLLVVELGRTRAAAYAAKLMADAGAEVLAVHDDGRDAELTRAARLYLDAPKEVLAGGPHTDRGVLEELVPHAAVLITDLPEPELAARGLDWATLHTVAPRLTYVWLSASGGPAGPDEGELTIQALSGLMHMVGDPDREPLALPYGIGAVQLGLHGAGAAAAGALAAAAAGEGHLVEIAGTEVLASYVRIYGGVADYYGIPLRRAGARAPGSGGRWPFGLFPCKDGHVAMICRSEREWQNLLDMMGRPEWATRERYRNLYGMAIEYPDEVDALVAPWLRAHTRDELLALAQRHAVPVAPVRSIAEVLDDPQLSRHRDFFDRLVTESGVEVRMPGRPWHSGARVLHEPTVSDPVDPTRTKETTP